MDPESSTSPVAEHRTFRDRAEDAVLWGHLDADDVPAASAPARTVPERELVGEAAFLGGDPELPVLSSAGLGRGRVRAGRVRGMLGHVSGRRATNVVIVEGTCGSGKTTLLRAAESMFEDREVSVLWQRATYAPIAGGEDDGTLDDESDRRALLDIVRRIREEVLGSKRLVLVDTLHATHLVRAGALTVESFVEIDRALSELGALVVVLRINEEAIRARTIVGRRGTGFYQYARKFGATEDDRLLYFMREQQRLIDLLATHSCLRQVVLDGDEDRDSLRERFRRAVRPHPDA